MSKMLTPQASRITDRDDAPLSISGLIAWSYALAPIILFLMTWSEDLNFSQRVTRTYGLPIVAVEVGIIAVSFRNGWRLPKPTRLPLFIVSALVLVAWAAAIMAPFAGSALQRTGLSTIHFLFALAIVNQWRNEPFNLERTRNAILTGFVIFNVLLVIFVFLVPQSADQRTWFLPAYSNVRWFGDYSAATIALCGLGFVGGRKLLLCVAAAAFMILFWTGTRGGLVAAAVGLTLATVLYSEFRRLAVWGRFLGCALAGFILSSGLSAVLPFAGQSIDRFDSSGRIELWKRTIAKIEMRPWLGWGEGQLQYQIPTEFRVAQPHNVVLQFLHAWGIVGTLLCLGLAVWLAPRVFGARATEARPFQLCVLMLGAYSLYDGTLYHVHSSSLFAVACALAIAAGYDERAKRSQMTHQ